MKNVILWKMCQVNTKYKKFESKIIYSYFLTKENLRMIMTFEILLSFYISSLFASFGLEAYQINGKMNEQV